MTINQIRYFLEVAKCLNFSTASRRLFMTQPALGRQITALETELNMQLFHRSTHGLRLTPAGEYLQKRWSEEMELFDDSILQAKRISEGYNGTLSVGILEGINTDVFLADVIACYEKRYPNIRLRLKRGGFRELREQLYGKSLDAVVTYSMDIEGLKDFSSISLKEFHPAVAIPLSNPLSKKEKVQIADLKDEELVITDERDTSFGKNAVIELCRKFGGFYPKLFFVDSVEETLLRVETSDRCALLNMQLDIAKSDRVKMFPVEEDDSKLFFSLAWHKGNDNIGLQYLRETAMDVLGL